MTVLTHTKPYTSVAQAERERRILAHMPLVKRMAHGFSAGLPAKVETADLVSVGTLGLIRAIDSFDPDRGVMFESFAARCIREAILTFLRAQDPLPYSTRVKIRKLDAGMLQLQKTLGRSPSDGELGHYLGYSEEEIGNLMTQASGLRFHQRNEWHRESAGPRESRDEREEVRDVLTLIEQEEVKEILTHLIQDLTKTERSVLMLYYYENLKMREIGELLGITESRISQIHGRALIILRAGLRRVMGP